MSGKSKSFRRGAITEFSYIFSAEILIRIFDAVFRKAVLKGRILKDSKKRKHEIFVLPLKLSLSYHNKQDILAQKYYLLGEPETL